jgi:cbb3-type cytochrome oxidase maturation protein
MSVIYILISVSITVAVFFLIAFIKAVKSGQYDDDYTPSVRMLFDDELVKKNNTNKNKLVQTKTDKQKPI